MKTFKTIDELVDSLVDSINIGDKPKYFFDLVNNNAIVASKDERVQFFGELSLTTNADKSISVDNLKLREFKKQLEMAEMIHTILSFAGDDSPIYEIWVLNGNSFNIGFKPKGTKGTVKTAINSKMLVQFDGDNMSLTVNAIVNAQNDKDDSIDWVFNGDKKTIDIVNLTVSEIYDEIMVLYNMEFEKLKANTEIISSLLNREPSDIVD